MCLIGLKNLKVMDLLFNLGEKCVENIIFFFLFRKNNIKRRKHA